MTTTLAARGPRPPSARARRLPSAADAPVGRGRRVFSRKQRIVISVLNLTAFFVIWQLVAIYGSVPTLYLPSVTDVFGDARRDERGGHPLEQPRDQPVDLPDRHGHLDGDRHPAGLLIGGIPWLDKALSTYVWALYTMPRIVLMPLLLLWVGINDAARIWIIVLSAVPATLVVIMEGVKTVDNSLLVAGRSFGASRVQLFTKVVMPVDGAVHRDRGPDGRLPRACSACSSARSSPASTGSATSSRWPRRPSTAPRSTRCCSSSSSSASPW